MERYTHSADDQGDGDPQIIPFAYGEGIQKKIGARVILPTIIHLTRDLIFQHRKLTPQEEEKLRQWDEY